MKAIRAVFLVHIILLSLFVVQSQIVIAAEDSWATMAEIPTPREGLGVAVVNGKICAIGGDDGNGHLGVNEEYDPATNTWVMKKSMPTPRSRFGITVHQNKIYVIGGGGDFGVEEVTGLNQVYDPLTDTWETKTEKCISRDISECY